MSNQEPSGTPSLKRTLTPFMVWGLGVGYVISGNYFGWNHGLEKGGTLGMAIALLMVIVLYVTFTFSYTELSCAIPKSGGAFDYAKRGLGQDLGFIAGMAQNIEFIFAPPAIAIAIGAYFNIYFSNVPVLLFAIAAYLIFVALNVYGVTIAAKFELAVTILAVTAIVFFSALSFTHFEPTNLTRNAFPQGWSGAFGAVPFAIWFFLGIEGVANLAEETIDPKRTIMLGFGFAITTLVVLCLTTFVSSIGISGWESVVYTVDGKTSDSPLPLVWQHLLGVDNWQYRIFVAVGLFGLVASFHGLMLAAGRSTMEFGRARYAPVFVGKIHPRFQTPANALLTNMILGLIALCTGKTDEIITLSVFGALTLYIISMIALLRIRVKEPDLPRPFRVPWYPVFPITALALAIFSLVAVAIYNFELLLIYVGILVLSYGIFKGYNQLRRENNL